MHSKLRSATLICLRWAPITALIASFLVLKAYSLAVHPADEGIYFYGALRTSEGAVPYRDFFFAHPPLHIVVPALLFWARGGFSLLVAKAVPFVGAALGGLCTYLIVRRLAVESRTSPASSQPPAWAAEGAALVAASAMLFSESLLKASSTATGINQTSGLLALGALLLCHQRWLAGGVATGAAVMTLLQGAPVAAVLAIAALWEGRRPALRFAAGLLGVIAVVHLVFGALAGRAFFEQVYAYHLAKLDRPGEGARQLGFILVDNWPLFASAALGVAVLAARRRWPLCGAAAGAVVLQLLAMGTRPRVFPFYFQPAFFAAAALAGAAAHEVLLCLHRGLDWRSRRIGLLTAAGAVLLLGVVPGPARSLLSPMRARQLAEYGQSYRWLDAPGLGALNDLVRGLFWKQGVREAGREYGAVTQYLWQRSRWLDSYPRMLARIVELRESAARGGGEPATLFGDSAITGMLAVDSGLRIAADFVDTNIERFRSGTTNVSEIASLLAAHPTVVVVLNPSEGIGSVAEMRALVQRQLVKLGSFASATGVRHELWARPDWGRVNR